MVGSPDNCTALVFSLTGVSRICCASSPGLSLKAAFQKKHCKSVKSQNPVNYLISTATMIQILYLASPLNGQNGNGDRRIPQFLFYSLPVWLFESPPSSPLNKWEVFVQLPVNVLSADSFCSLSPICLYSGRFPTMWVAHFHFDSATLPTKVSSSARCRWVVFNIYTNDHPVCEFSEQGMSAERLMMT